MKKIKMVEFVNRFNELESLDGFKFVIMITRNLNKFKEELEILEKARLSNIEYNKYIKIVTDSVKLVAEKDNNGNFVISKDVNDRETYTIPDKNKKSLQETLDKLSMKYKECIAKQEIIEKEFIKELDTDIGFDLNMIEEENLPNQINSKQLELVYNMVIWK